MEPRFIRVATLLRRLGDQLQAAGLAKNAGCPPACNAVIGFLGKLNGAFVASDPDQNVPVNAHGDDDCEVCAFHGEHHGMGVCYLLVATAAWQLSDYSRCCSSSSTSQVLSNSRPNCQSHLLRSSQMATRQRPQRMYNRSKCLL